MIVNIFIKTCLGSEMNIINEKIKKTKAKKYETLKNLIYFMDNNESLKQIAQKLQIDVRTLKKWSTQMNFIQKIENVKIDRALSELIFSTKEQILCFEYLIQDYNYFLSYEEVLKEVKISRYYFKAVKNYIKEELVKAK